MSPPQGLLKLHSVLHAHREDNIELLNLHFLWTKITAPSPGMWGFRRRQGAEETLRGVSTFEDLRPKSAQLHLQPERQ